MRTGAVARIRRAAAQALLAPCVESEDGTNASRGRWLATIALASFLFDTLKQWLRYEQLPGALLSVAAYVALALLHTERFCRAGCALAVLATVSFVAITFPTTANHGYLALWVVLLSVWHVGSSPHNRPVVLAVVRWLAILVLFWAGLHKVLRGTYEQGEYMAFQLANADADARYLRTIGPLIPAGELSRLAALPKSNGPYALTQPLWVFASNAIVALEIGTALLLLFARRSRTITAAAATAFVIGIQYVAREFTFALLMAGLLSAFGSERQTRITGSIVLLIVFASLVALTFFEFDIFSFN